MRTFLFIILVIVAGCGSQKDLAEIVAQRPQWAKSKPVSPGYYTGLGTAPKAGNPQYYQQQARSNALKDIAEEISVNISSSSALRTMEFGDSFNQQYTSNIVTNSSQNLEGYELVDTYEDELYYFVLYQLSKPKFEKIRQERIRVAVEKGKSHLKTSARFQKEDDHFNALSEMIKALESIRPHLHESLETSFEGEQVYLGNHITSQIQEMLRDFELSVKQKTIRVKRGNTIEPDKLKFQLKDKSGNSVTGMKLTADFSAQMLVRNTALTDQNGMASFAVDKIVSESESGIFTATVDLESILESSTNDLMVRKMIRKMSVPEASITIQIESPGFFILLENEIENTSILKSAMAGKVNQRGFKITGAARNADFVIKISTSTSKGSKVKNMHVAWLSVEIAIQNANGEQVYNYSESGIKGIHMSEQKAMREAFKNAAGEIENRIFDDFYYQYF